MDSKFELLALPLLVCLFALWSMATARSFVGIILPPTSRFAFLGAHQAIEATGRTSLAASVTVPPRVSVTHLAITSLS